RESGAREDRPSRAKPPPSPFQGDNLLVNQNDAWRSSNVAFHGSLIATNYYPPLNPGSPSVNGAAPRRAAPRCSALLRADQETLLGQDGIDTPNRHSVKESHFFSWHPMFPVDNVIKVKQFVCDQASNGQERSEITGLWGISRIANDNYRMLLRGSKLLSTTRVVRHVRILQ
ncbi:hypothetical protein ALC62_01413, partial [Cyphomyrmex costatus]